MVAVEVTFTQQKLARVLFQQCLNPRAVPHLVRPGTSQAKASSEPFGNAAAGCKNLLLAVLNQGLQASGMMFETGSGLCCSAPVLGFGYFSGKPCAQVSFSPVPGVVTGYGRVAAHRGPKLFALWLYFGIFILEYSEYSKIFYIFYLEYLF